MSRVRIARALLTALFLATILLVFPRRPLHHLDFSVYVVTSLGWLEGENLYDFSPATWARIARDIQSPYREPLPFFYSPASLAAFLPVGLLTQSLSFPAGALLWDVFKILALWWTLQRARRWVKLSNDWLYIAAFLWLPLISDFSLGQINLLILAAFSTALSIQSAWRGALLGLGFHLKGLLIAPLGILLVRRQVRAFLWGLVGMVAPAAVFALIDSTAVQTYFFRKLIPYLLSPAIPLTDPDLLWLIGSAHLSFAPAVQIVCLLVGVAMALLADEERTALVMMAGTAALFSGVTARGHLLILLPVVWLLLEAAQARRLGPLPRGIGLVGFAIFTVGNLLSLVTVDLPRLLGMPLEVSPIAFAAPVLSLGAFLLWAAFGLYLIRDRRITWPMKRRTGSRSPVPPVG